ncbi:MAG: metallophosphoesterase [Bacteroidales bacterium]|nr:metallophosphoesterase [Bacteroidales bacterium]
MNKKTFAKSAFFILLLVAGYFLTAAVFPKNLTRYPFFIILVLMDLYLWTIVKAKVFTYNVHLKRIIAAIYWSPLMLLSGSIIVGYFLPSSRWLPEIRIYMNGFIFIFYVSKMIPAILLLLGDLVNLTAKLWIVTTRKSGKSRQNNNKVGMTRSRFLQNVAFVTGGLMLSTMFAGMLKWVHDFRISRVSLRLQGLPLAFDGFKIIQISDLHLGSWSSISQLEEAVELINAESPDLIVFTGDLVNYSTDEAFRFKETLSQLQAGKGVYAILGNHDYGDYMNWPSPDAKKKNMQDLHDFYYQLGWKLLKNNHDTITIDGESIGLIGVENWSSNKRFPRLGNVEKASKGLGPVPVKILLSHDPSHFETIEEKHTDIQLTLSGHTHGFQFGIEIPGIKWSPAQYMYKKWAGLYESNQNNQYLYVNRGLGSIGYPGRIGILPEITVINLFA